MALVCEILFASSALRAVVAKAQFFENDAQTSGQGNIGVAFRAQIFGMSNPATTAGVSTTTLSLFTSRAFGLKELQFVSAGLNHPVKSSNVAAMLSSFGFDGFRRTRIGVSLVRPIAFRTTRNLHAAGRLEYYRTSIRGYGSAQAVTASGGLIVELTRRTTLGAGWQNVKLAESSANTSNDQTLTVGLTHKIGHSLTSSFDAQVRDGAGASFRSGVELWLVNAFALRTGYSTNPDQPTIGFGLSIPHVDVDVGVAWHTELGITTAAAVEVSL